MRRLPGNPVGGFLLLGGLKGLVEHLIGIYRIGVLEKVPFLHDVSAASALLFSVFEYILYWVSS